MGATRALEGINFALMCRRGTAVWLVLSEPCNPDLFTEVPLDPQWNKTGDHWHVRVGGLPDEFCYGYRVDGPIGLAHRYDPSRVLLDPNSRALSCGRPWGFKGNLPRRSLMTLGLDERPNDVNPRIPREDMILYELHVRGFTNHPSSKVRHRGTYLGLIEKIPYLRELGVTTVELLPIDEFDENDCPFVNPLNGERLRNYWGYNTIAFAAPKSALAMNPEGSEPWNEFRTMVGAFHEADIEVVLDVVINHTAEGGDDGPTYSLRGLDNEMYYMLDDRGRYLNFTGCGNTVNSNHPVVRQQILTNLRNMVAEAAIDGLRFDLASVLGRDKDGNVLVEPPVIEMISEDCAFVRDQADRRALGRGRLVSGRQLSRRRALVGLERGVSRRRPPFLARRRRDDLRARHSPLRQRRSLSRPRTAPLDQLHHLPRRLHASRSGFIQPEAQ